MIPPASTWSALSSLSVGTRRLRLPCPVPEPRSIQSNTSRGRCRNPEDPSTTLPSASKRGCTSGTLLRWGTRQWDCGEVRKDSKGEQSFAGRVIACVFIAAALPLKGNSMRDTTKNWSFPFRGVEVQLRTSFPHRLRVLKYNPLTRISFLLMKVSCV